MEAASGGAKQHQAAAADTKVAVAVMLLLCFSIKLSNQYATNKNGHKALATIFTDRSGWLQKPGCKIHR